MAFDFAYLKEHKYLILGIVGVGAVALYAMLRGGSQSDAAASTGIDPTLAALYQTQAAAQAQQSQESAELDAAQITANTTGQANQLTAGVDLAQIQASAGSQNLATVTTGDVDTAQIQAQIDASNNALTASTTASTDALQGLENTNASQVQLSGIQAGEAEDIANISGLVSEAAINGQVQSNIDNTNLAITAIKQSGGGGGTAGEIGGLATLAAAFI